MLHRVVEQDADLAGLRETWHALLATHPRPLLPLSWDWFSAWWHSFRDTASVGAAAQLCIHVFGTDDAPRAIVPMLKIHARFRGVPVRALATMTNGHSPLWDAILHPGVEPAELDEIGRALLATPDVDVWLFRRIAAESRLLEWLRLGAGDCGRLGLQETVRTPIVHATGGWDDYLDQRSRKYRRNVRKKVRTWDERPGTAVEHVPLRSGRDPALDEVVEVSRRSWKTRVRNDLGTNEAGRQFLRQLVDRLGPRGDADVWLARIDGRAVAYELHVRGGGVTYPIRADIDEAWRDLAPGSVLEYRALEAAFEDPAIDIYDTCAANYWYLTNLTDEARFIHDAEFFPRRLKADVLYLLEYWLVPRLRPIKDFLRRRRSV